MVYLTRSSLTEIEKAFHVFTITNKAAVNIPRPMFLLMDLVKGMAQPGTLSYQGYSGISLNALEIWVAISPGLKD